MAEAVDFGLEVFYLVFLFLVYGNLLGDIILCLLRFTIHGLNLGLQALFIFLALGELDFDVPQALL